MGSDRGEDAYRRENKMTMTTLLSLSLSLVSLRCMLATSLTATRSYLSVGSFVALGPWVHVVLSSVGGLHCCWWALVIQQPLLAGLVAAGRSMSLLGCWPLFAARSLLCMRLSIGQLSYVGRPACLWWGLCDVAASNVEGTRIVVDVGDVGVRVVVVFCCQAVVVVCGWPGMFVVVGVTSGRRGGRPLLSWWLWDEERSCVTICDNVTSELTFRRACVIALGSCSCPNL